MKEETHDVDWEGLVAQLPGKLPERFELLLRRSLKRSSAAAIADQSNIPACVRSEALGIYRKQYMKDASKAARRRMTYERARRRSDFRALERKELEKYLKNHPEPKQHETSPGLMTLSEVCNAYRAASPTLAGSSLEHFAVQFLHDLAAKGDFRQAAELEVSASVLSFLRKNDVLNCATFVAPGQQGAGRPVRQGFHVQDLTTQDAVAERIRSSYLVDGVLVHASGQRHASEAITQALYDGLQQQASAQAVLQLITELFGDSEGLEHSCGKALRKGADAILRKLHGNEFSQQAAEALLSNPRYRAQFDRAVELQLRVRQNVPQTPMEAYPLARTMQRRFVLHVGPTNSGKTHDALEALMHAASGAYLGPLRLLAYEQFELMNREGCSCTLLTGEELIEVAHAQHVSSTVEMADFHTPIEVAVIDEAQMIADPDRGHNWTAAILGIPAREVHVCCAPHAEEVVRKLIELCSDECSSVAHQRLIPLKPDRASFCLPDDVAPGDALIVFSPKAVHAVASQVVARGLKPSLVYGALPYDVRHEEARRFDAGETDVVVATDAIGMGMNLPIRRIVFVEQQKFDGRTMRQLRPEEVQQIAGRAGRFGRYDVGYFQSTKLRRRIRELYHSEVGEITSVPVGIPDDIALVQDARLSESILQWMTLEQPEPFVRINIARDLALIGEVEARLEPHLQTEVASKQLVLSLATMAFDEQDEQLHRIWLHMVDAELAGQEARADVPAAPRLGERLADLEESYRHCDLLYTYARTFDHPHNVELLAERRAQISHAIMTLLAESSEET